MKRIAQAFTSLFKPTTPRLRVQLTTDDMISSSGPGQTFTISEAEYIQLREIAKSRDEEVSIALSTNKNDVVNLKTRLEQIDQQFDAAILSVLLSKQSSDIASS